MKVMSEGMNGEMFYVFSYICQGIGAQSKYDKDGFGNVNYVLPPSETWLGPAMWRKFA